VLFACYVVAQFAAVVVISRMHSADGAPAEDVARGATDTACGPIWRAANEAVS
jgi:hypothetical protein